MVSALRISSSWSGNEEVTWLNLLALRCQLSGPGTYFFQQ
jgi:hypothetical protein